MLLRPVEYGQCTCVRFTETVALEELTASIGTVGDAHDNAAAETVMSLPDVGEVTFDWVSWYNNERLHSFRGNIPSEEYERNYYAQNIAHQPVPPTKRRHENPERFAVPRSRRARTTAEQIDGAGRGRRHRGGPVLQPQR